jgi:hypothetical protein
VWGLVVQHWVREFHPSLQIQQYVWVPVMFPMVVVMLYDGFDVFYRHGSTLLAWVVPWWFKLISGELVGSVSLAKSLSAMYTLSLYAFKISQ